MYSDMPRTPWKLDSYNVSDAMDLSILPGIHGVNPGAKNVPLNTYGFLIVIADSANNWRLLKFIPTNVKSYHQRFYNGYDKTWSDWESFTS